MSNKRKLEKALTVRLSPNVYKNIVSDAKKQDITACSLIRRLADNAYSSGEDTQPDVKAYKPRQPPKPEHIKELYRLRESVAELCGSLVYSSIKERKEGNREAHRSLEEIISDVRQRVRDIDKLRKVLEGK